MAIDSARGELLDALAKHGDRGERVPWYGPSMSVASLVTARLMEVWAHGQDVVDTLGLEREPTARMWHIAHLGERWTWGQPRSADRIVWLALDFCWVVTQRRHVADTDLAISGNGARAWMAIAQAFAGPPGPGRKPGQFAELHRQSA
jgi:hypothetical protein